MDKIVISRAIMGIFTMQVCCEGDVTDTEILEVCNSQNPAGTSNGWTDVKRATVVQCKEFPTRVHFLVTC